MKVLMLETSGWGGLSHYSHCLSEALAGLGIYITLITNEVYELRNAEHNYDVLPVLKDGGSYHERMRQFMKTLREESPDILHIQSGFSARKDWLLVPMFKKHCERLVVTAHNVLPHEESERKAVGMEFTLGRIYRSCDGIIAHSDYTREALQHTFSLDGSTIEVIQHGNYLIFSHLSSDAGDTGNTESVARNRHSEILFFGHLREYKGVDVLLRAFGKVRRERNNISLVIAGKEQGGIREKYDRIIEEEGVTDSVVIKPGYVQATMIGEIFSKARLVVFPYRETDGSGVVQLAYSFGKPVVATSVGVLPEIVEEGVNGFVVPPEDPDALAGAINRFLELTPQEAGKMGQMSKLFAEKIYSWRIIAGHTVDFYRSLL